MYEVQEEERRMGSGAFSTICLEELDKESIPLRLLCLFLISRCSIFVACFCFVVFVQSDAAAAVVVVVVVWTNLLSLRLFWDVWIRFVSVCHDGGREQGHNSNTNKNPISLANQCGKGWCRNVKFLAASWSWTAGESRDDSEELRCRPPKRGGGQYISYESPPLSPPISSPSAGAHLDCWRLETRSNRDSSFGPFSSSFDQFPHPSTNFLILHPRLSPVKLGRCLCWKW